MVDAEYPGQLQVTRSMGTVRPRTLNVFVHCGSGFEFGVHNADVDTGVRALVERVFLHKGADGEWCPVPELSYAELEETLEDGIGWFRRNAVEVHPWSPQAFVGRYRGRQRLTYEKALASLMVKPLTKEDSYLSTFVKAEKLNLTAKPDPSPRVIQPRGPRFNICLGRYLAPIEKEIYKDIDRCFSSDFSHLVPSVMKGLNAEQRGAAIAAHWGRFEDPVCIGYDASRMDQHYRANTLKVAHKVYGFYNRSRKMQTLLKWQRTNRGFMRCADGTVKYRVSGKGASGDIDTSLRNILLMALMAREVRKRSRVRFSWVNDGDDSLVFCERRDVARILAVLEAVHERSGFPIGVEPVVDTLEQVEFCQTRPIWTGEKWVMCRDPRLVLSKDLYSVKSLRTAGEWNTLRNSVSQCGLSLAGDLPILGEFYAMLGRGAGRKVDKGFEETGFARLAKGMSRKLAEPTQESRVSFWKAFGILPDEQVGMEELYRAAVPVYSQQQNVYDLSHGRYLELRMGLID